MKGPRSSYRCRSDPQIADDVMRTIASVGCSITGSGTSSTVTVRVPCQVSAFMSSSSSLEVATLAAVRARGQRVDRCTRIHDVH
jgi:hypothetical protein